MNCPSRVSPDAFMDEIDNWLAYNATPVSPAKHDPLCRRRRINWFQSCECYAHPTYRCVHCESIIEFRIAFASVHYREHCVEANQVEHPEIPFCPVCNHADIIFGCVHMPVPSEDNPSWIVSILSSMWFWWAAIVLAISWLLFSESN